LKCFVYYKYNVNILIRVTHLGLAGGIGLGPESVLLLEVPSLILSGVNLGELV